MDFKTWTVVLVHALRSMIPTVLATRTAKTVTLRERGREVRIVNDGASFVVWIGDRVYLSISQHDEATARTAARSLATHFDVERWGRG